MTNDTSKLSVVSMTCSKSPAGAAAVRPARSASPTIPASASRGDRAEFGGICYGLLLIIVRRVEPQFSAAAATAAVAPASPRWLGATLGGAAPGAPSIR